MPTLRMYISNYNFIPQRNRKTKTKVSRRKQITKIKEIHKILQYTNTYIWNLERC